MIKYSIVLGNVLRHLGISGFRKAVNRYQADREVRILRPLISSIGKGAAFRSTCPSRSNEDTPVPAPRYLIVGVKIANKNSGGYQK
jgi:hypothetical protein